MQHKPPTDAAQALRRALRCCLRGAARGCLVSGDDAVDLEALRVVAVDVDAVRAGDVPDVLRIRIPPVLLGRIAGERRRLPLDVALLKGDVRLVGEIEVVPRNLVAE